MPPKNKKKGRKDDDDVWEAKERAAAAASATSTPPIKSPTLPTSTADASDDDNAPRGGQTKASAFSFANMDGGDEGEEDAEDFGGLMSALKSQKKKDKKNKAKAAPRPVSDEDEENEAGRKADEETAGGKAGAEILEDEEVAAPRGAIEVSTEDMFPEEVPKRSKAGKKAKGGKGKKGGKAADDEEEEDDFAVLEKARKAREEADTKAAAAKADESAKAAEAAEQSAGDEEVVAGAEGEPTKVLSKKEKERVKKEKEKAKKKAQAQAKKAATASAPATEEAVKPAPVAVEAHTTAGAAEEEGEDADDDGAAAGGGAGAGKSKKKKKKKAGEAKEPEPVKEESKKKSGKIGALRAAMEERQRLEAEAKAKAEEEERLRREEEERAVAEEKRKEEEKQRKKEREKAKKEELRKAGKLLTPKQKAEKAAAEARRQALIASGVQISGLQDRTTSTTAAPGSSGPGGSAPGSKKVNYGAQKKKGGKRDPLADKVVASEGVKEDGVAAPVEEVEKEPVVVVKESAKEEVTEDAGEKGQTKDSWDAESDADVKDDWEASSQEDEAPAKATTPAKATANGAKPAAAVKATAPTAKPSSATGKTNGKPESSEDDDSDEESDSEEDSDEDSEDDDSDSDAESEDARQTARDAAAAKKKAEAAARRQQREKDAIAARSADDMRSPICCILGHVDTGKTKLLDKIRQTNVQEGEAGGITQQIGATFFPMESVRAKTRILGEHDLAEYKLPGLLVIDTPGHESFTNLRSRGSTLCNIAILVIDIMHGMEPQTRESLEMLRSRKTPFVVALNKIDRIFGWAATRDNSFRDSLSKQNTGVQRQFADKVKFIKGELQSLGLNSELYYENPNFAKNVSIVPTSAITGEGVPDLLMLLIKLTQERMSERLMYLSTLECTVLEVKVIEGLGTTIDVVLSNGVLREGDRIVVCGLNGAIVTQVRALLTPQLMRELRVKGTYVHHQMVKAALGVKIVAPDLDKAIAGSRLLLLTDEDDEEDLKDEVMEDLTDLMSNISPRGVAVQASTLGSLEALLSFLKDSKIPISAINVGPVFKRDVMRAGIMLEKAPEYAVMLCFDVPVDKEAEALADESGVKIFKANIIYHLFDAFQAHQKKVLEAKRADAAPMAVWPVRLKVIRPFATRDPIIVGCDIIEGIAKVGTPICVVKTDPVTKAKRIIDLGKITGLEINHQSHQTVKKEQVGAGVAVKIEPAAYQQSVTFGRHIDASDEFISHITRQSLDVMKELYRDDVVAHKTLLFKLKSVLGID